MIGALIGPIAGLASTFLEGHLAKSKANTDMMVAEAKAKANVMERQATGEIDWDLEAIKGSQNSWKDEWLVILFSIPLILAFIPGGEEQWQKIKLRLLKPLRNMNYLCLI